jgi:hypothetical protein
VVEHLLCKCEALKSNPSPIKRSIHFLNVYNIPRSNPNSKGCGQDAPNLLEEIKDGQNTLTRNALPSPTVSGRLSSSYGRLLLCWTALAVRRPLYRTGFLQRPSLTPCPRYLLSLIRNKLRVNSALPDEHQGGSTYPKPRNGLTRPSAPSCEEGQIPG